MEIKEILYAKNEAFVLFQNGTIACRYGTFTEDPQGIYIHDVYKLPEKSEFQKVGLSEVSWMQECRNIEEMNAIAHQKQLQEYRKKVKLIRKQWKAQQPSLFNRLLARVKD